MIEVNKATAKKWRSSTKRQQKKLAATLQQAIEAAEKTEVNEPQLGYARPSEEVLTVPYEGNQKNLTEYQNFLQRIRTNAAERGLTQEILDELLKEDA